MSFLNKVVCSKKTWIAFAAVTTLVALTAWLWLFPLLKARHYRQTAEEALAQQQLTRAYGTYQKLLELKPDDPQLLLLTSRLARQLGAEDHSRELLDRYRQLNLPINPDYILEQLAHRAMTGDLDEVEPLLRGRIQKQQSDEHLCREALSDGLIRAHRNQAALDVLHPRLDPQVQDVQAQYHAGRAEAAQINYAQAIVHFRKVIDIDPARDDARLRLAESLWLLRQITEAQQHYELLQQRGYKTDTVHLRLARIYREKGNLEKAKELLEGLFHEKPEHAQTRLERGLLALDENRLKDAERELREAQRLDPTHYPIQYALVLCLGRAQSEDLNKQEARLHSLKRDFFRFLDITAYELERRPWDLDLRSELGRLLCRLGNEEEGLRILRQILAIQRDHKPTQKFLAQWQQHR